MTACPSNQSKISPMGLRSYWLVGLVAASGILLSACGNPTKLSQSQSDYLTSPNVLACTNMNVVFLGEALSPAINRQDGQNAVAFGLESRDPALSRAANHLRTDSNAKNQTAVNKDVVDFVVACHKLHLGPTDNNAG